MAGVRYLFFPPRAKNLPIVSEPLGKPGEFPYTRGIYPDMYRGRLWTMRQYAGFGSAEESNQRYRYLLSQGTTGLSVAFDLPTQMGMDSDHPLAAGEVGRTGVAISSLADMERLFQGIPLGQVSTSMTINSTAAILLALYVLVARRQGVDARKLSGTVQNDILKEYIARGTYIYPPRGLHAHHHRSVCLGRPRTAGMEHHLDQRIPHSRGRIDRRTGSGVHFRQRHRVHRGGADGGPGDRRFCPAALVLFQRAQQFSGGDRQIPRGAAALRAPDARPLRRQESQVDDAALSRADRRLDADRTTTRRERDSDIAEALSAVLGGAQSLHTNSRDEALALPTEESARLALRTQQIIAHESGVTHTADPMGGSEYIESLTAAIERGAKTYLERIAEMGGTLQAIEHGFIQGEIQNAAFEFQKSGRARRAVVVGVNRFRMEEGRKIPTFRLDPAHRTSAD